MKWHIGRWRLTTSVLLAVAAACTFASNVGAQEDPCDPVADRLLEAKLYDKAQIAYAQVKRDAAREGTATPDCVRTGLGQIFQARAEATRHYARGQAYEESEKPELARDEYVEALRADPTFDEASAALDRLLQSPTAPTTFEQRLEVVRALESAGLHEAAVEELKETVEAYPEESLPPDMRNLVSGTISPWGEISRWIDPREKTAVEVLRFLAEVLIGILLLVALYHLIRWTGRQLRLRLDIQDLDKGSTDLELGKALPALIEEAFHKLDTSGRQSRTELLTGPIDKDVGIRNITNLDPRVNLISQLIDVILPPNVVTLAGSLQRSKARGAGVSVTLTEGRTGKMLANESIWLKDYDPKIAAIDDDSEPFYALAEPTAIWTLYSLQKHRCEHRILRKRTFTLLGTGTWRSYAYFRAGVRYDERGSTRAAREMYYKALAESPENFGACLNLATLDALKASNDDESNPHALKLFEHVKDRTQQAESTENVSTSPAWYVATYQLATAYDYRDQVWLAYPEAHELVQRIDRTMEHLHRSERSWWLLWIRRRRKAKNKEILQFLDDLKPLAVVVLAAILIRRQGVQAAEDQLDALNVSDRLRYRVRYNLACYHSRLGERRGQQGRGVAREQAYKLALENLRYAFERQRSLIGHAREDKSLKGVREAKKDEFNSLIKRYSRPTLPQPADQLSLAGLEILGEPHAKELKQQGIVSRDDLVTKAATPAARRKLAKKIGVSPELLKRWALLADMMRVTGTDVSQANLLVAANVDSLRILKESEPEDLALVLHQVNLARSLVKQPPELETVRKWVREAARTKRMVKDKRFSW